MESIGIIGQGFVGEAVREGMKHAFDVQTYDIAKECTCDSLDELVDSIDRVVFVCLPTPMKASGECDTSIVFKVIQQLCQAAVEHASDQRMTIVIKSTMPPKTTQMLNMFSAGFPEAFRPQIVFSPEFLTEADHINDFKNQNRIVIGSDIEAATAVVSDMFAIAYPCVEQVIVPSATAEMIKYTTNVFLATKVSLANELYQVCERLGVDWDEMIDAAKWDERLGQSHWKVPGPMPASDGSGELLPGFSGSCFVKDINGLMHFARELGIDPKVMKGVWDKNMEVRPRHDWEHLVGRAVVEGKEVP